MNSSTVLKYWTLAEYHWNKYFTGLELDRLLIAVAILLCFLVLRRVLTRFILHRLQRFAQNTASRLDDQLLEALRGPASWVPAFAGLYISLEYLNIGGSFDAFATRVLRSVGTVLLFWALVNGVRPMAATLASLQRLYSRSMLDWLVRAVRWALIFLASALVLELWGIRVGPILAGFGLLSVAVALGAQDLFKNLISGILILMENWFETGEWIKVDGVIEGTVERIGFRTTLVRRFDLAPVHVPNTLLADNALTNFSRMTRRRIHWTIGVTYDTTVDQLRRIRDGLENYILDSPNFAKPPQFSTFVRIDRFSDSSIDIMLYCFTESTKWGDWLQVKEQLAYAVKRIVEEAGSSFAFPSRSIYMADQQREVQDQPEHYIPPAE